MLHLNVNYNNNQAGSSSSTNTNNAAVWTVLQYEEGGQYDVCPICTDDFNQENPPVMLKCAHMVHEACIIENLHVHHNNQCPTCKTVIAKLTNEQETIKALKEQDEAEAKDLKSVLDLQLNTLLYGNNEPFVHTPIIKTEHQIIAFFNELRRQDIEQEMHGLIWLHYVERVQEELNGIALKDFNASLELQAQVITQQILGGVVPPQNIVQAPPPVVPEPPQAINPQGTMQVNRACEKAMYLSIALVISALCMKLIFENIAS